MAARVLLVIAAAAAAVILANVALLGIAQGNEEPVGKLRPGVALTSQPATGTVATPSAEEPGDDSGGAPDSETGEDHGGGGDD